MSDKNNIKSEYVNDVLFLQDISKMILTKGNLSSTSSNILELISQKVKTLFYVYFLIDDNNNLVLQSFTTGAHKILQKIIPFDVFKIKYPLTMKDTLITQCVNKGKIVQSHKLRRFFSPVFKPGALLDLIQKLLGIKSCVGIPILHGEKVIGAIAFGSRKKQLNKRELDMLALYANLSGIAINNSIQFEKLEKQYEIEKTTTSILSHELKTPIAIAHNSSQLIYFLLEKSKKNMDEATHRELSAKAKDIQESINRMAEICNSIFSLREVEAKVPQDIHKLNLEQQLEAIIRNFQRKAENKGIAFEVYITSSNKKYYGGIVQLEQIITILLDNAIKYTKKGAVVLEIVLNNKELQAIVRDTGVGIPEKEHDKIFEQFYRRHLGSGKDRKDWDLDFMSQKR